MSKHYDQNDSNSYKSAGQRALEEGATSETALRRARDNGEIAIETWTVPSGDVPIVTFTPVSNFIKWLENSPLSGVPIEKFTAGVRESVATEGVWLHTDLVAAMAYALVNHPEDTLDWWSSVGIVRQGIARPSDDMRTPAFHTLVHPGWSPQIGWFDPATGTVEPLFDD